MSVRELQPADLALWEEWQRHPELSRKELAEKLGYAEKSATLMLERASKLFNDPVEREQARLLVRQEEKKARAEEGAPPLEAQESARRARKALKEVTSAELSKNFSKIAHLATKRAIALLEDDTREFELKELGVIGGIAVDKRAILRGEPTQIVEHRDMQRADDVARALMKELQKRGVVDVTEFTSEPAE